MYRRFSTAYSISRTVSDGKVPAIQASINQSVPNRTLLGAANGGSVIRSANVQNNFEGDQQILLTNTHSLQYQIQNDQYNLSELFGGLHYLDSFLRECTIGIE